MRAPEHFFAAGWRAKGTAALAALCFPILYLNFDSYFRIDPPYAGGESALALLNGLAFVPIQLCLLWWACRLRRPVVSMGAGAVEFGSSSRFYKNACVRISEIVDVTAAAKGVRLLTRNGNMISIGLGELSPAGRRSVVAELDRRVCAEARLRTALTTRLVRPRQRSTRRRCSD